MTTQLGWQLLLDRIATERDPRHRRNLEVVARHVVAEVAGDMPALLATLVPEPRYHVWGASSSVGPQGRDEVIAWYHALNATGRNRLDYVVHRVVVDDGAVVTEGDFQYAIRGDRLAEHGTTESGDAIDAGQWYLVQHRTLVVWPVTEDGLIEGEDMFAGERHRVIRRLAPGERPDLGPVERG